MLADWFELICGLRTLCKQRSVSAIFIVFRPCIFRFLHLHLEKYGFAKLGSRPAFRARSTAGFFRRVSTMSKQAKRKITVDVGGKAPEAARPSVFERLGTKKASSKKAGEREHCRQWAAHGVCAYGKGCKFATTHTLISPSKARAAGKEEAGAAARLHSAVVRADELDAWDQNDLEYADTDVLEKRRQQLQRELELQLKMDSGKEQRKGKKKPPTSSSSSRSSSSSTASSSSSAGSSSNSSSGRDGKKKSKKGKPKRNSSSSSEGDAPSKKKKIHKEAVPRGKAAAPKKAPPKKDDRLAKKHDAALPKKKVLIKLTLGKKSLSPVKKSSATPPIAKGLAKNYTARKHSKSPPRREKNRSISPPSAKDKDRDRQREREREKDKEKERRAKSKSIPRKARSRSPLRKDLRRKQSSERGRPISPKKAARHDQSTDKHRKSPTKDRDRRDHKDVTQERRKEDKDRHEREKLLTRQRERDRPKDIKRDTSKRPRDRRDAGRGLEKPNKPMERLLPRPEERMAALAAISNRNIEPDKSSITSKDRLDSHSERGRKLDRNRDRCDRSKRDRMSLDRDHEDYERGLDRSYDRGLSIDRGYERVGDRYDDVPREGERSPGYARERHYDPGYDIPGHPRGYPDAEERGYVELIGDQRAVDLGFDERRARREHSWDGSEGRLERERERGYPPPHAHKEWEGEEFRAGGDWARERHWQHRNQQMGEWAEKEVDLEAGWHRAHAPPHARPQHPPHMHDEGYARGARPEHARPEHPRTEHVRPEHVRPEHIRPEHPRPEHPRPEQARPEAAKRRAAHGEAEPPAPAGEEPPVPDDLSEISDDPDDILDRDDMERAEEEGAAERAESEERTHIKLEPGVDAHHHAAQDNAPSSPNMALVKTESQDSKDEEEMKELDFEEISDGELEEERTRAGLGDALGVDWASLVAEVRRSAGPAAGAAAGGARRRWRPADVLARVGVSVAMAGAAVAAAVVAESRGDEKAAPVHPVASIQVALERRRRVRAALLGGGCATRALSARRDLALRRHLCALPPERAPAAGATPPPPPRPHLFHAARALLMRAG